MKAIKVCCEMMKDYTEDGYIKVWKDGYWTNKPEITINTALYEENPVNIDYCPFCGKKIEIIDVKMTGSKFLKILAEFHEDRMSEVPKIYIEKMMKSLDRESIFAKILKNAIKE